MSLDTHKKRTGSVEVAATLRRQIREGTLAQHDRLASERLLAETFGVSRGTVRDALLRLEREGLVETRPGSGTYVVYSSMSENALAIETARPLELMDARFALEPHVCRLAVLHARRADFEVLDGLIDLMEASCEDPVAFGEADTAFHTALVESTGNNLLIWIISQIKAVRTQDEWGRMRQLTLNPSQISVYNAQHRQIVNAIRSREPERAATLMKEHLEAARLSLTRAAET